MSIKLYAPFYEQYGMNLKWRENGYDSEEESSYWEGSCCGILCLKMAIDGLSRKENLTVFEYIKMGIALGAYSDKYGWIHAGLVQVAKQLGVDARAQENMSAHDVREHLNQGNLILVSVKANFEAKKNFTEKILFWKRYGGHMGLVVGYEDGEREGFLLHHTSRQPEYNGPYMFFHIKQFCEAFTGRGIIIPGGLARKHFTL